MEERLRSEQIYTEKLQFWVGLMYASLEQLIELDIQLNALQPIHSGRLRIQWFAYNAKEWQFSGERYPLFVQWRRNFVIGLWRAQRVPLATVLKYQCKTKEFKPHALEVKKLLSQMRELILSYRQARKTLRLLQGSGLERALTNMLRLGTVATHLSSTSPLNQIQGQYQCLCSLPNPKVP